MPVHNGFHGHIVWADSHSKVAPRTSDHIRECAKQISSDGMTVTCHIAAETGRFFAGTSWSNDRNRSTAQPYTAEFIRDGESVHFAVFDRKTAAKIQGIAGEWNNDSDDYDSDEEEEMRRYYFMFRSMEISGEDDGADTVPDDVGKLEIVIRTASHTHDNNDNESDGEGEDESESGSEESSTGESDDDGDETYIGPSRIKKVKDGAQPLGKSPADLHDIFTDWGEKKPRQTHTAAMTRSDGTLWRDRRRYYVPTLPKQLDNDEELIVHFIFIYTSKDYIRTLVDVKPEPCASVSSIDIKVEPRTSPPSSSRRPRQSTCEDPDNDGQPARKRRHIGLADYVKTEDEQQMFDEMLAYQEKVSRLRITLDARRRARGDAVEGDKDAPIEVDSEDSD